MVDTHLDTHTAAICVGGGRTRPRDRYVNSSVPSHSIAYPTIYTAAAHQNEAAAGEGGNGKQDLWDDHRRVSRPTVLRLTSNDMAGIAFSVPDALTTAAAAVAIAGSAVGVYTWCRSLYRRSIGSRRDHERRFNQIATNVTIRYIEERFGAPAFIRDFDVCGVMKLTEQLFHTRHAWLQILTNENKAVVRFSITVTDPRFHFQILHLTCGQLEAKIGRSRFSEIRSFGKPKGRSFKAMVRRQEYSESYWLGMQATTRAWSSVLTMPEPAVSAARSTKHCKGICWRLRKEI